MRIKQKAPFAPGYQAITTLDGEHRAMLMDFGILKLVPGLSFGDDSALERVFVLLYGQVEFSWAGQSQTASRSSFLDDQLWCLNVPGNVPVQVVGLAADSEVAIIRTRNDHSFEPVVRSGAAIIREIRGAGSMNEAGTRLVRTAQDVNLSPHSNIMFGEDVQFPGKWAGFPSHYHAQPEIYFYKLQPENGFGLLKLGDEGVLLEHNDTVLIAPNLVHPQVAAPGYAMYFLWIIRHLDGNPYLKPTFEPEHLWVEQPGARYWPDTQEPNI
jgi:5-deoxy-glucuronate isomerase